MLTILQWVNTSSVISKWDTFLPFFFSFILLLLFPSIFIVSGVKGSIYYPVFISNVIIFSILFTYILIEGLPVFFSCFFFKYILEVILNIWWRIWPIRSFKLFIPCRSWYFKFIILYDFLNIFPYVVNSKLSLLFKFILCKRLSNKL